MSLYVDIPAFLNKHIFPHLPEAHQTVAKFMRASKKYTTFEDFLINTLHLPLYTFNLSNIDVGLNDNYEVVIITAIDEILEHTIRLEAKTSSPSIHMLQIAVKLVCEVEFQMNKGIYFSEYFNEFDANESGDTSYVYGYKYEEVNVDAYVTLDIKKGIVSKVDILAVNPSFV